MIETIIYNYLSGLELSAPVYTEVPEDLPSTFYLIEKTGGTIENHISKSTIAIQSYGESLYEAIQMNEEIKEVMIYGLINDNEVASISLNSDYNYTDTTTKQYRYQAVFEIVHY